MSEMIAQRYVETRYGMAHVTLTKAPAAQGGYFESAVSVEGNIGTAGPYAWARNHVLDYAVDMFEEVLTPDTLDYFISHEVLY